ncbi:MAG: hypothetical protein Ta2B_00990 [Termitinemataceae bacterium]|nr:MAG: hypothetical protein Ta2B_00990 [Termitinemataceae bacterium]
MQQTAIEQIKNEIASLEKQLADKKGKLEILLAQDNSSDQSTELKAEIGQSNINNSSHPSEKIALFRSLFKGREDIYAKRFESKKTGKSGYQPVCKNEWAYGICGKPKIKCASCEHRSFEPISDTVIKNHLSGFSANSNAKNSSLPFVMGIYPLLQNETCNFLACDFDKATWQEDAKTFIETCKLEDIPASLERSRSGNGAHIWIFFESSVQAVKARKLGSFLMTRTLDRRPEIGLDSFDRFFPRNCSQIASKRKSRYIA